MKVACTLLFALCVSFACQSRPTVPEGQAFGEPLVAADVVPLATVVAAPADYLDRTLLVSGVVTAVCQNKGCWMQMQDGEATSFVRWETGCGGRYEFPTDAIGREVVVQGSFYSKELSPEDAAHLAEEAQQDLELSIEEWEMNASGVLIVADDEA